MAFSQSRASERREWLTEASVQIAEGTLGLPAAGDAPATELGAAEEAAPPPAPPAPPPPPAWDLSALKRLSKAEVESLLLERGLHTTRQDGKKLPVAQMRELLAGGGGEADGGGGGAPASSARRARGSGGGAVVASEAFREDRTFSQFVREELVHFSLADNRRSLPSLIDGLKPSQRKAPHPALSRPRRLPRLHHLRPPF